MPFTTSRGVLPALVATAHGAHGAAPPRPTVQFNGSVVSNDGKFGLPFANVTIIPQHGACGCTPVTQLAALDGSFSLQCRMPCATANVSVWARQYLPLTVPLTTDELSLISLMPREMPNFPASKWRFEGWPIESHTGNVTGTDIYFLAHPSAYRTPSGRIFIISTAHGVKETAWTQGYWQEEDGVEARALPYPLINGSHPVVKGVPFTARMVFAEGRLLMTIGMGHTYLLENKNLDDPSNPEDWQAVEGDGRIIMNYTGAPTNRHEDSRLHVLPDAPCDAFGRQRKYWLLVIAKKLSDYPGRACGRMAFTAENLSGPYEWAGWWYRPEGTGPDGSPTSNCWSWPGDLIETSSQRFFTAGWGQLYVAPRNGSATFSRLDGDAMIAMPSPSPAWDDIHQIEFTFLPPGKDGRWRMYHASYSTVNGNPYNNVMLTGGPDAGYKQAIGMYTFEWPEVATVAV